MELCHNVGNRLRNVYGFKKLEYIKCKPYKCQADKPFNIFISLFIIKVHIWSAGYFNLVRIIYYV